MKKTLLSRGFLPTLLTAGLMIWFGGHSISGEWWRVLFFIAVSCGPAMIIPYIMGCMTGIDNIYSRISETEQSQKDEIARLQADVLELKNYIYQRFG